MNAMTYMFENGTSEVFRDKGKWLCQSRYALFGFIWHINLRELKLYNGSVICNRSHGDNKGLKIFTAKPQALTYPKYFFF